MLQARVLRRTQGCCRLSQKIGHHRGLRFAKNAAPLDAEDGASKVFTGSMCVPHPDKVAQGVRGTVGAQFGHAGEDAYFVHKDDKNLMHMLGVSDGVYEWTIKGIDPGIYSRSLMQAANDTCHADVLNEKPLHVLEQAHSLVTEESIQGSTTVLICSIDLRYMELEYANLGDSALMLVGKDGTIKLRSTAQEHVYGCPHQLGHHEQSSSPESADVVKTRVEKGDVVVLGTDGLFDNVMDHEIAEEVLAFHSNAGLFSSSGGTSSKAAMAGPLARQLVKIAFEYSMDRHVVTPYSIAAQNEFDMIFNGGKKDDITVVVGVID